MIEETTLRPEQGQMQMGQMEMPVNAMEHQGAQVVQMAQAGAFLCPQCGAVNEAGTVYCASCGALLRMGTCPNCGSEIDPDADFCEVCHHYVRHDVCSFCGGQLSPQDAFCPECGSPRGGIVCPTCRTLNEFAFCKQCGTPLTEEATLMVAQLKAQPDYRELVLLAREYNELSMQLPITSERDQVRDQASQQLRERVLKLLAQDEGVPDPVIPVVERKRVKKEELDAKKEEKLAKLTEILNRMEIPANPSPAKVRNYAMAQKPSGVRLAWVCNWKHAMHSSPCGCAKPQLGGKWVILGRGTKQEIKDDK